MADELEQLRDEIAFAFDIVVSDRCGSSEDAQDVRMWRDKALAIVDEVVRLRQRVKDLEDTLKHDSESDETPS